MSDVTTVRSTGIGSFPGTDIGDALKIAFAECPELPYLPELPSRGAYGQLIGRSTAFLADLTLDLQPSGWRLAGGSGRDHRLAKATLRSDLDQLEEQAQGYAGPFKLAVAGPWTLAASVERTRGDRLLADHGARRFLAESLAEGTGQLLDELQRRLPALELVLQLDEPSLPAVLAGRVPTASGFSRHRVVDLPEASAAVRGVAEAAGRRDVATWVHCCAAEPPIDLLRRSAVGGLLLDLDQLTSRDWDLIGPALEEGLILGLGAVATGGSPTADQIARRALAPLRALPVDPARSGQLVVSPACGLGSRTRIEAVELLRRLRTAADIVTDQLAD